MSPIAAPTSPCAVDDIILVDEQDRPVGSGQKLAVHEKGGQLHRAFSIFLFNSHGQMLLQQRAPGKYHFGGLWTNACCSHPRPGERTIESAQSRLQFELGIQAPLSPLFGFVYRAFDEATGLTEHEFDHVFTGRFEGSPRPNADEVLDWRWAEPRHVLRDVRENAARYTPWFRLVLERVLAEEEKKQPAVVSNERVRSGERSANGETVSQ